MINIPLKLKYRNPNSRWVWRTSVEGRYGIPLPGTSTFNGGRFSTKPRTNVSRPAGATLRPRRRAYGPF